MRTSRIVFDQAVFRTTGTPSFEAIFQSRRPLSTLGLFRFLTSTGALFSIRTSLNNLRISSQPSRDRLLECWSMYAATVR